VSGVRLADEATGRTVLREEVERHTRGKVSPEVTSLPITLVRHIEEIQCHRSLRLELHSENLSSPEADVRDPANLDGERWSWTSSLVIEVKRHRTSQPLTRCAKGGTILGE
jgi:hypothetical protein